VIADGLRRVPQRVVGVDDDRAFAEIGFDVALVGVAGVDQQDGPAICRPRRAQVVDVASEQGETAEAVSRKSFAVQIARADNRQRDQPRLGREGAERRETFGCCKRKTRQRESARSDPAAAVGTPLPAGYRDNPQLQRCNDRIGRTEPRLGRLRLRRRSPPAVARSNDHRQLPG
jgi:hypothetical protein